MATDITRRDFFKMVGVGGTAATLVGCGAEPPEKLIPYLVPAEEIIPGVAVGYATVCGECPAGCGMVVKTREGRAVKAEGNPAHPVNRGALCARGQASLQGLYNPDRLREPLLRSADGTLKPVSWEEAEGRIVKDLLRLRQEGRADRAAFITALVGGSLRQLIQRWMGALGSHRSLVYEPFAYEGLRTAHELVFGLNTIPKYDFEKSKLIVSLGADFLETWLSPVEHARGFSGMRSLRDGKMGRFYHAGPRLSLTAANADDWISTRPGTEGLLALGMIHVILFEQRGIPLRRPEQQALEALVTNYSPKRVAEVTGVSDKKITEVARAFTSVRPSLAIGGEPGGQSNSTLAAAAAALLNYIAGNIGETVEFRTYSALDSVSGIDEIVSLTDEMNRGEISALFVHGANPVFSLPQKTGFREALKKVSLKVAFSEFMDETTAEADVVLPMHDALESWGDYSPREGVHSIIQPVMRPIFSTRSLGDTLIALGKKVDKMAPQLPWPSFHDYLRESWAALQKNLGDNQPFESFWQQSLRQGGVWKDGSKEAVGLNPELSKASLPGIGQERQTGSSLYLHLYPSGSYYDGRGANRPWLQELPDPMTQITWGNWAELHPQTATRLGVVEGTILKISSPSGTIEAPAHLYEGVRADTVALPLGQGHTVFGRYASKRGTNPMALVSPKPSVGLGGILSPVRVKIEVTPGRDRLASTAGSRRQDDRGIAQAVTISEIIKSADATHQETKNHPQFRPPHPHPENRWGMVIDLNACTGCSACMVACSAENNVPTVGKENVLSGREMFWIRIERYVETDGDRVDNRFLPMLCQHCDNAPCEPVCPTYATYHREDGLNTQVYNRCVGTRYCSNNCPYKVRRFNWFEYDYPDPLNMQLNPDVTVRSKGVMEKCTFCVQRIRGAKDVAKDDGRPVRDGEITPACVQTCPTSAIVFGDLKDPESQVYKRAEDPRRYRVLENLNTEPAIIYLKKIRQDNEV